MAADAFYQMNGMMAWKRKYRCKVCGYEAEVYEGRGSDNIRIWDMKTCPQCQGEMEDTGDKEFWT